MAQSLANFLITSRWWLLLIATGLGIAAWGPSRQLSMDRSIEQMFPTGDPSVESYQLLRQRFGGNAVAMLVYRDPQLLTTEGLDRVAKVAEKAEAIPGVLGVLTLAQVNDALSSTRPGGLFSRLQEPPILGKDRMAWGFRKLFEGYTHDSSGNYAVVVSMLDPANPDLHDTAVTSLRNLSVELELGEPQPANQQPSNQSEQPEDPTPQAPTPQARTPDYSANNPSPSTLNAALVGEPVLVAEGFTLVEEDGHQLSTTTIILLGLTTLLMFRSPRWVLAELIVIFWAVTLTKAAATVLGLQLSMVSSMLTAVVTVIAVACVIHIAVGYGVRRRRGDSPHQATRRTFIKIMPPIIWACITDAAGFAALMISSVGPVRDFGLMMTLGTGMVLASIILIIPGVMLFPPQKFIAYSIPGDRQIRRFLVRLILVTKDHRIGLAAATLIVLVLTAIGLSRLETETNFIKNFRAGSELARSYAMVESEFGGAGVWDVILPMPQDITRDYLAAVQKLERSLRKIEIPIKPSAPAKPEENKPDPEKSNEESNKPEKPNVARLTKVLSMADADAVAGSEGLLSLAPPNVRIAGMRAAMPTFVDALITPSDTVGPRYLRIMLRSPERLPAEIKLALIDRVDQKVQSYTSTPQWLAFFSNQTKAADQAKAAGQAKATASDSNTRGQVTGYYVLLARLIDRLLSDQWLCLSVAAVVIFIVMWIAFRSFSLAAICMVPNLLPVLFVLGVIGLLGIRVNMGAAMIAAVSIGLTIDGSIHFLSGYQSSRRRGDSRLKAVLHSQRRVGLPVLLASIALALGFSVLTTSDFIPTVTFGLLVSAALAAGTLANLTLLPLLLISLQTKKKVSGTVLDV